MVMKIFQRGFNYSQDGQGNRLVYHLQGCNMHCPWCANPEGMVPGGTLMTEKEWLVEGLCPRGAVKEGHLDRETCSGCTAKECLSPKYKGKGIRISCEEKTVDEIFDEIIRSSPMFYDGGGATFTGGEATLQFDALKELLVRLKEAGIHTAVETNGSHPRLPELFPYIDQLIMDCKHWDSEKHLEYTKVPMDTVVRNLEAAVRKRRQVDIRIPLIGGVNDSEEDMQGFVELFQKLVCGACAPTEEALETSEDCETQIFLKSEDPIAVSCREYVVSPGNQVTFEILKYHEYGKNKWKDCGWEYQMTDEAHVTIEQIRRFKKLIIESGLNYKNS